MIKHVELTNKIGKVLRGYLDYPTNFNGEIVVFFHGFTGNKTEHAKHFLNFSRMISRKGYASLRLDFYGNGESDGNFEDFTMDTLYGDAEEIINAGFNVSGVKKLTLLGFSMGGAVATYMAGKFGNKISKLILWSPATEIDELVKNCFEKSMKLENGNAYYSTFEISNDMYESLFKYNIKENVSKFTNPVLLINGRKDTCVKYIKTVELSVLFPNSRLHIINEATHGYDGIECRDDLYNTSMKFLEE